MKTAHLMSADELLAVFDDPTHPNYERVKDEILFAFSDEGIAENLRAAQIAAKQEADQILAFIQTDMTVKDVITYPPISMAALLSFLERAEIESIQNMIKHRSIKQSNAGKNPRPRRQHKNKPKVYGYYLKWHAKPELYGKKSEFVSDMLGKGLIENPKTVWAWLAEWPNILPRRSS